MSPLSAPGGAETDTGPAARLRAAAGRLVTAIDAALSAQVTEILEAAPFAALEARWRGLADLVHEIAVPDLKVRILDLSWGAIAADLGAAGDLRRSHLHRLIGAQELDTLGGEPFGVILVDHALSMDLDGEDDLYVAELLAGLGERCLCPFVCGIAPEFPGERDAGWITDHARVARVFASAEYSSWRALRAAAAARYLGLAFPQIHLRGRYEHHQAGFRFHQRPEDSDGLWGNAGWAFLRTVAAEYARVAWFGFLKLVGDGPGSGAVLSHAHAPAPRGTARSHRARLRLTHGLGAFYAEQGFIPLCESAATGDLYFFGNRSVAECRGVAALEILTQLQSTLISCRLGHYIKIQLRRLIGQSRTAQECELQLNNWLEGFCSRLSEADQSVLARFPLRSARVRVRDAGPAAARYTCEILLEPQYQIDHLLGEIVLSTEAGAATERAAA